MVTISNHVLCLLCTCRTMFANLSVHQGGPQKEVQITAEAEIYTDTSTGRVHDIMLLQLPSSSDIQPIKLPDCDEPPKR